MRMTAKSWSLFLLLFLTHAPLEASDPREFAWIEKGKETVKMKLKDPDSAQFRNVFFHRGEKNVPMACGEVNSKNSFGGFVGYQRFISAGRPDLTFFENEVSGFNTSWNEFCVR